MDFVIEKERIFKEDSGQLVAEVTFPLINDTTINVNHTFVDSSLRGQGVASKLIMAVVEQAKKNDWKIKPTCSYAVEWFEKHKEYSDLLA